MVDRYIFMNSFMDELYASQSIHSIKDDAFVWGYIYLCSAYHQ